VAAVPVAVAAVPAAGLAFAQGGYFATAWGWEALALFAIAATALVVRAELRLQRYELVALAAAGGLLGWILLSALWAPAAAQPIEEAERMRAIDAARRRREAGIQQALF
jgi:hypothetical protein